MSRGGWRQAAAAQTGAMRCLVLLTFLLAAPLAHGAALVEPTPRLTTDTPDYCRQLAARLERLPARARQPALRLGEEGVRLCGTGRVRTGIVRLRSAIRAAQAAEMP
jgi:hypothetical protein